MSIPYENTTSGERALAEIQKLLRGFGCSKFGSMIDDAEGTVLVQFEYRGKPLQWNTQTFYECPDCGLRGDARAMGDEPKTCRHLSAKPTRRRVFCASLADVFDNEVDPAWRRDLFDLIELTPNIDWLLLTKRIGNVFRLVADARTHDWLAGRRNVWLGATICNQEDADRDIPKLLKTPAAVRWVSMEPLLGPVNLQSWFFFQNAPQPDDAPKRGRIDWIVVGGESGPNARPMHPDWARNLRDQCAAAGVPFLFKQWGEWAPNCLCDTKQPHPTVARSEPGKMGVMFRCGKKSAGRLLDGVQHDGYPGSAMKERPILFSAPMVRAILEGRKTQTRRVVKPQPHDPAEGIYAAPSMISCTGSYMQDHMLAEGFDGGSCPYGQPGDRLWVRESWRIGAWNEDIGCVAIDYMADGFCRKEWLEPSNDDDGEIFNRLWIQSTDDATKVHGMRDRYQWEPGQSPCRIRPSIHMPRWASRITLEITGVKVERLQDISEEDARAEGTPGYSGALFEFSQIWKSINGPGSWDANPWVWVIQFRSLKNGIS